MVLLLVGVLPNALSSVVIAAQHQSSTKRAEQITGIGVTIALILAFFGISEVHSTTHLHYT